MVKSNIGDIMKKVYIKYCECEKCSENKEKTDLIMAHTAIHYIVDGYGFFNGVKLCKGDFFCAVKNEKVCYYPQKENPWTYIYMDLYGEDLEEIIEKYDFRGKNSFGKIDFLEEVIEIHKLFEIRASKNMENESFLNSLALTLLSMHTSYKQSVDLKISDVHVKKIQEYIDFNFNKKISISSLAKQFYLSCGYIRNIFYDRFHMSPKQYLQNLRMKKAAELLEISEYRVSEISVSVGYEDQLAFSKTFKSHFGTSPTEYRKLHRKNP